VMDQTGTGPKKGDRVGPNCHASKIENLGGIKGKHFYDINILHLFQYELFQHISTMTKINIIEHVRNYRLQKNIKIEQVKSWFSNFLIRSLV